jgi:hypothetical protein
MWRRLQRGVAKYVYVFLVVTAVVAGILVEALRAG